MHDHYYLVLDSGAVVALVALFVGVLAVHLAVVMIFRSKSQ